MTHLKIEQNTGVIEEVPSSVIKKLYDLAISGTLDVSSDLKGRLSTTATYEKYAQYLTSTYSELYITANKYYVDFVDPLVESRLLAFNIGDGTGVTLADMLNATIGTGDVFYNTAITSFDEFLYFTKPSFTSTCQNFCQECKQLTSITYPPQMRIVTARSHVLNISLRTIDFRNTVLTTIGGSAFEECTSLESVYLPNTCTNIEGYAFFSNSSLTTIDTSNVVTFGRNAFERCTALLSIDLSSATSIGLQAFKDCTNLTTVTLNPASTSLPPECFSGCSNLSNIDFSNITNFGAAAFLNCTSLGVNTDLDLDLDGKTFGANAFRGTGYTTVTLHSTTNVETMQYAGSDLFSVFSVMPNLVKLDYSDTKITGAGKRFSSSVLSTFILPKTTTYIAGEFESRDTSTALKYIVVLATTPPSWSYDATWSFFGAAAGCAFYVPDSAYSAYQAASGFSNLDSTRLKRISELPASVTWYTKEHPSS